MASRAMRSRSKRFAQAGRRGLVPRLRSAMAPLVAACRWDAELGLRPVHKKGRKGCRMVLKPPATHLPVIRKTTQMMGVTGEPYHAEQLLVKTQQTSGWRSFWVQITGRADEMHSMRRKASGHGRQQDAMARRAALGAKAHV